MHLLFFDGSGADLRMRILIVDDHELIRKGVRSLLQTRPDFEICGDGVDGQEQEWGFEECRNAYANFEGK